MFSGILCPSEGGLLLSQAELRHLKNTIWKTLFAIPEKQHMSGMQLPQCLFATVGAEIITELILERASPVIFKSLLLELMAFRLIPVIGPARKAKPDNYWKR